MQREWGNSHKIFNGNLSQSLEVTKTGEKHGTYVMVSDICGCDARM